MILRLEGIILKETPYGDNSKIVNILTKDKGMVGVMCNGVKSIKSPLRAKTQLFSYGYFHINYNDNKLSKLVDVDLIDSFKFINNSLELKSYMIYLVDLTYQVVKQSEDPNIYTLLIDTLNKLNEGKNPLILSNILELKYLDYLGVPLNLDSCVDCGNKTNIVTLDPDLGGYVCSNCYRGEKILDPKSIKLIRMYYLIDIKSISDINISKSVSEEINYFIDKFYDRYTGLYLKSKNFLKTINKL